MKLFYILIMKKQGFVRTLFTNRPDLPKQPLLNRNQIVATFQPLKTFPNVTQKHLTSLILTQPYFISPSLNLPQPTKPNLNSPSKIVLNFTHHHQNLTQHHQALPNLN